MLNETVIGSIAPRVFSRFVQQKLLEFLFDLCTGHCPCETLSGALFGSQAQAGDVLLSAMALLLLLLLVLLLLQTAFILSQLLLLLHGLELLLQLEVLLELRLVLTGQLLVLLLKFADQELLLNLLLLLDEK